MENGIIDDPLNKKSKLMYWDVKVLLIILLGIFIFNNYFAFKNSIDYYTKDSNYPKARSYMASAIVVNQMYIYPISKIFWWDCTLAQPFYFIRDKLFDIGYSKFPKDEGEKEFWWYAIKFKEYETIVNSKQVDWCLNVEPGKYLDSKKDKFIQWDRELSNHVNTFTQANITANTDKTFAKQKLEKFVNLIRTYQVANNILNNKLENDRQVKLGIRKKVGLYPSDLQVKVYDQLYQKYLDSIKYAKVHEKASYDYYYNSPDFWLNGEMFVYYLSLDILQSKFYSNKLQCNDKYLKINVDTHKKIREYYFANKDKMDHSLSMDAGSVALTVNPLIAYKCRNNPCMKDYIQYILSQDENKKIKSIEELKNNYVKGFKIYKKYDRLEQLRSIGIK